MEETAALISADIEIKSNETGTAYLFKDTLDLTSQSLDIFDNYVSDITANTAIKTEISANTLTNLSTSGLEAGQYHLYIIDTTGNISTQSTNALTLNGGNALSSATISNLVGGTGADTITGGASADILTGGAGADTITGGAGADTLKGGIGADTLTGNTGADIFYYGKENITRNLEADADTITDFDVTTDKLNLIDVILYASGGITDSASLAKYIHAEADTSVATNVKLYIKTQGDIGGTVNDTNSNVLINFTVADATAQTELVNALSDNTLSEYILS
jgi:Ca2+-binding RTX toxin-like protein